MKNFKKLIAVVLVALMALSLTACIHKKNEVAVTIGDVDFTSAYYMCALINANSEGQQKVSTSDDLSDAEKNGTEAIDYQKKKIDKKKFSDWVEDRAIEMLKEIAAYKTLCKDNDIKLSEEQNTEAESVADYYWSSYGYSTMFEPNGVSQETYKAYMKDSYYAEAYFQSVYGKEGKKALKAEDVKKEISDNYILVDVITSQYEENATDADKKKAKQKLEGYAEDIKNGKTTFEKAYKEFNSVGDETETETETEDELKPVNKYATVMGSDKADTYYQNDNYAIYKKYAVGTPKVVESADGTGVSLVIKRNLSKDAYYMDRLDTPARHTIADEDFQKEIDAFAKKMKVNISKYATGQFKVKDIIIPESNGAAY